MIILGVYRRFLQRLVGLDPRGGCENIYRRFIYSILLISFVSNQIAFFILNIADGFDRAVPALPSIGGVIPAAASYLYLLINSEKYYSLLDEMECIVNESK